MSRRHSQRQRLQQIQSIDEIGNRFEDSSIGIFLSFAARLELAFGNAQRMVAAFNDMQEIWRFHPGTNALKKVQGAK
jgi:hypothetical protein